MLASLDQESRVGCRCAQLPDAMGGGAGQGAAEEGPQLSAPARGTRRVTGLCRGGGQPAPCRGEARLGNLSARRCVSMAGAACRACSCHSIFRKQRPPLWLHGASFEVQRKPFGMVLVIGPGNYPLFLPAVHALQALVAGNAVLLKPAPGAFGVACAFAKLARLAGLSPALLTILPESIEAARLAIAQGVEKWYSPARRKMVATSSPSLPRATLPP